MKFCRSCGTQLEDSAAFCHQCGEACEQPRQESRQEIAPTQQQQTYQQNTAPRESGMTTVIKVMMILGTVSSAAWILPLGKSSALATTSGERRQTEIWGGQNSTVVFSAGNCLLLALCNKRESG